MKIRNNKFQITSNIQNQNSNSKIVVFLFCTNGFLVFGNLVLLFVCDLWFGIWDFRYVVFAANDAVVASEALRDVRSPVYFPANYFFLLFIFFLLLVGALGFFIYLKQKKKKQTPQEPVDTRSAWEIAYDQLAQLAKNSYLQEGRFKEYYSELSGIIRYYFENRFRIRAPEMTTEEFLWSLERSGDLTADHKDTLKKFMTSCDIIKFAKHIPHVKEAQDSFRFAKQLVDETKIVDVSQNPASNK